MLTLSQRGSACFDVELYRARNKDLPPMTAENYWLHFVMHGQFEGRPSRWAICTSGPKTAWPCSSYLRSKLLQRQIDNENVEG